MGSNPKHLVTRLLAISTILVTPSSFVESLNEIEIGDILFRDTQIGDDSGVHFVGVRYDLALSCLPKNLGQPRYGNCSRINDVGENLPWSHRRKLVDIANDHEGSFVRQGFHK